MSGFKTQFLPRPQNPDMDELIARASHWREAPELFLEVMRPDATVTVTGDRRDSPIYGAHRGREQILELLRLIDRELAGKATKNLNVVVEGDRFAIRRVTLFSHRGSAQMADFMTAILAHTSEGLIDDVVIYIDTALLHRLTSN